MTDTSSPLATKEQHQYAANLCRLIAHNAYTAWTNCLIGDPPPATWNTYQRMKDPQVGDLVLELTTYHRSPWDPGALGYLLRTAMEPMWTVEDYDEVDEPRPDEIPTEPVWYLRPFVPTEDGKWEVRWHNADFIAIPDRLRWGKDT